ncbi:glycoside hydrolase family 76 protein [Flavitalea flava]
MKQKKPFRLFLFLSVFSIPLFSQTRPHTGAGSYEKEMTALRTTIEKNFFDSSSGYYKEWPGKDQPRHPYTYLWSLCALFQAGNEIEKIEPGAKLLQPLLVDIRDYYDPAPPQPGYADYIRKFTGGERYYDDNQWLGITALDAFSRTKQKIWLQLGKEIYTFMMTGYDTVLSGGLYWKENQKTSKNTCSNGPGILVALQLYQATKEKKYLDTALLLYEWTNKKLQAPSGLYYDNISIKDGRISKPVLSYNTGTMLQSNIYLYESTGNGKYLKRAKAIADSSLPFFYGGEHFRDAYWFNAVLLRAYQHLLKYDKDKRYILAFKKCLDNALHTDRNAQGLFAEKGKTLDLVAHGGMLEILARFAWLEKNK